MSDIEKTAGKIKSVSENHRRISQNFAKIGVGAQELIASMSLSTTDKDIVIPEGVYVVPDRAYYIITEDTYALESVTFPRSLRKIGVSFFGMKNVSPFPKIKNDTDNIVKFNIPSVEMWLCGALGNWNPWFETKKVFAGEEFASISDEILPEGLTDLKAKAFSNSDKLVSVDLGSVETVGRSSFENCKALVTVNLLRTKKISNYAFYRCTSLRSLSMPEVESIGLYAFSSAAIESIDLPQATYLDQSCFSSCYNLVRVKIPQVKVIMNSAFRGSSVKTVKIPDTISIISADAFSECASLRGVSFGSVPTTRIDSGAFKNTNVNIVCVPWSEGEVAGAPWGMTTAEIYYGHPSNFGWCLMDYTDSEGTTSDQGQFYVYGDGDIPDFGSRSAQIWASKRRVSVKEIVIDEGITGVGDRAFAGFTGAVSVKLPSTVRTLGKLVFDGMEALPEIELPEGVTTVSSGAFQRTALKELVFPSTVESIGGNVAGSCAALERIIIQNAITPDANAFIDTPALKSIQIKYAGQNQVEMAPFGASSSVVTTFDIVGFMKFAKGQNTMKIFNVESAINCISNDKQPWYRVRNSIEIAHVSNSPVGDRWFAGFTTLHTVGLAADVTRIGVLAFNGCTSLETITLPPTIKMIDKRAFQNCTSLNTVTISSVCEISGDAFLGCKNLTNIYLPKQSAKGAPWGAVNANIHFT